jgi:hypothetical protein
MTENPDDLRSSVVQALQELEWLEGYVGECIVCAAPDFHVVEEKVRMVSKILRDGMQLSVVGEGASR